MSNSSVKPLWKKFLKWLGVGLLSLLLLLSPFFWLGIILFAFAIFMWLVEEVQKAISNGTRSAFKGLVKALKKAVPNNQGQSN